MSRNQHKKCNCGNADNHSESCSSNDHCSRGQCSDQRACIICPPCDYREKFESSRSDSSCPDFFDLCEDKPKICCEKKDLCKKGKKSEHSEYSSDSSESSESSKSSNHHHKKDHKKHHDNYRGCGGCDKRCNKCALCKACGCNECSDYSRNSVLSIFGTSESSSECPRFNKLAFDEKRKCCEVANLCKKPHNDKPCHDKPVKPVKPAPAPAPVKNNSVDTKESDLYSTKDSVSSSSKGKKFIISFKSKEGHPWAEYNESDSSVHINGKNGPVLHLYRSCTYFFCIEQELSEGADPQHTFVLTNSPAGGANSRIIPNGFVPVSKGCVCFKVDKSTPRYFFYQDSKHAFAGGLVIVHDK